jgi:N6-L-threonylcarbamoyladenine synthase
VRILGIESSCDETAAAVVENGETVLSSVVASQMSMHDQYGGVVPELASREHLRAIVPVVRQALERAGTRLEDLSAIAATVGPGLLGSLLVGLTYAKSLSFATGVPLIGVNHIEGHIHAVIMETKTVELPALALVVSGGHTHLFEVLDGFRYRLLGKTRDDAAGEAFDKVAKLLGFGYPGGPIVDKLASFGNSRSVRFTFAKMKGNALDFSFSGLKTAVRYQVAGVGKPAITSASSNLSPQEVADVAASFQEAVIDCLVAKAELALIRTHHRILCVGGGVAANGRFRARLEGSAVKNGYELHVPPLSLCTDNAVMGAIAIERLRAGLFEDLSLDISPGLVRTFAQ